ncbi:two-component system sensor histidine kinase QseC [Orbus hercynius]|uniref:Sensor protein QseC n=1 Tax=Orbus hercynius TaxID=593135 RepID=A0A495REI1_9GAMM|nr:quorum sensing histidine kinase QseC [Orbus hercynius]RKS85892.1 two-component system sensor histidine kinase QseC [Orbus hercynius]
MKSPSLRLRLTLFISGILLLAYLITTSISYFELKNSLNQLFDSQQLLFAKRLAALNTHGNVMIKPGYPKKIPEIDDNEIESLNYDDDALAFAVFNRKGEMIMDDGEEGRKLYFYGGFFPTASHRAMVSEQGRWRILWLLSNDNRSVVAVGQKLDYQQDILTDLIYKQLIPWLITFIIVILFVAILIGRSFTPIKALATKLANREPDEDTPINLNGIPKEISPFIQALNKLFGRISSMITHERQFISDAAHELRTPLAALRVQTEVAQLSNDDPVSQNKALSNLLIGIDRTSHLVDQLLTLSRLDSLEIQDELKTLYWRDIISQVKEELSPLAMQKQLQITIDEQSPNEKIIGQPLLLSMLTRNLINNSIRYIPTHSCITITIAPNIIYFADNGPGVSDDIVSRLGERFYRPAGQKEKGSGLGLSIVRKIAELHKITVKLSNQEQGGFMVTLSY